MFKIPQSNKQFKQDNSSDRKGNIAQTKNISFDKKGYIKLANKSVTVADSVGLVDLVTSGNNTISSMVYEGNTMVVLGTKSPYDGGDNGDFITFTKNAGTGVPTALDAAAESDAAYWLDGSSTELYVANDSETYKFDGSTWTALGINSQSLCVFKNLNQIAMSNDNEVYLYNSSQVLQNTLVLPVNFTVTKMAWNKDRLYLATRNSFNKNAILFVWDGLSSAANEGYEIDGHTIYSVVSYKQGCACITSEGELLYNAGGWQTLDRLPIYYKDVIWQDDANSSNGARRIAANAMVVDKDNIYIGLNSIASSTGLINDPRFFIDFPAGVWCYDPEVGLHHKYSIDGSTVLTTNAITTANVDTTTNIITVAGVTVPETGTPVFYYNQPANGLTDVSTNSASPLKHGLRYYTIYQSGTTLKLAETLADAIAGTAIDITSTGSNSQYLIFSKTDEFGQIYNSRVTALCLSKSNDNASYLPKSKGTTLFIGGSVTDKTLAIKTVISVVSELHENRGYLITPWFESAEITDNFNKFVQKFKPLMKDEDKIVIKYRTSENVLQDYRTADIDSTTRFTEQWVDGNTFTSTHELSDVQAGDEVEIISGQGSGFVAHITSITESSGTYTINIDETVPSVTAGDKLRAVYARWAKSGEANIDDINNLDGYKIFPQDIKAKKVQFKIEFRGFDIQTEEIIVNNETDTPIK